MKILEDVMFHQKLPPGVMNVLIDYVMRKTDKKLTKAYVETIASHWARKSIQTTANAMALAKKEHQQYLKWAENKKVGKRSSKSNTKKLSRGQSFYLIGLTRKQVKMRLSSNRSRIRKMIM